MKRDVRSLLPPSRARVLSAGGMCLLILLGQTAPILGNPTGGTVASGKASIGSSGSTETINQTSRDAIINWQTFSINSGETTKFLVPSSSSATLNRVTGGNASAIYGSLESNGKIILINPNGILIGPSGRIDTASFLGSTLDITDADFLKNGSLTFTGSGGSIENDGSIQASSGDVYLLATQVTNAGSITAAHGTVGLGAGTDILLQQKGDQHLFIQPGTASGSSVTGVTQSGSIQAATAELKAAGGNAYALAINNSGTITATGFRKVGGEVFLTADTGAITNSGSIRATTGKRGGKVSLTSVTGKITNSGTLDASATGAGKVGGSVLLKSTQGSVVNTSTGQLTAHGGLDGQGGQVEMSGGSVEALGLVDTTSVDGKTGMFTIDPATFTVSASGGDETGADVAATLATTDVTLNADNAVTINDGITWTSENTLTLSTNVAGSTIAINAPITGSNGGLTLSAAGQGDAITASGAVSVANFNLQSGTWTQNSGTLPTFVASHDFEVQSGATFLRAAGGTGTANTPYLITDVYGLQGLASSSLLGADAQLTNNIDATGTATWNSGAGFEPIGTGGAAYTGTFNGGGNVVEGLTINRSSGDVGLFGVASGTIENVGVQDANITGGTNTGGLVGALGNDAGGTSGVGTVVDSYVSGNVVGGFYTGGLVGLDHGTSISESYSSGTVRGDSFVGGLVGSGLSAINNSYSVASVTASGGPVGGLEGENYYGGSITDSYSSGAVSGLSEVGGFVGRNLGGNITACFFDDVTSGQTVGVGNGSSTGVTGDTTATLLEQSTYSSAGWNIGNVIGENTWVIIDGQTRPLLGMEYGTTINNGHQLQLIGLNSSTLTANYTVGEDIDLSGTTNAADIWGTSTTNGGGGFVPIGTYNGDSDAQGVVYHGVFDGAGYSIDQLYINRPTSNFVGLFGDTGANTTLENTNLTNVNVTGGDYVGGLSAVADSTFNYDSSSGTVNGAVYVGGLVGIIYGSLNTSYSTGTVNGSSSDIGGLAGYVQGGTVDSCYSTATVAAPTADAVGGLIGENYGTVSNVFSTGAVSGNAEVGGLIGYNGGSVSTSYTASPVSGSSEVGAFIGNNGGSISECLFDTQTAGVTAGVGTDPTNADVTGLTTAQLMSESDILAVAPNWNFETVWTTNDDTTLPELIGLGGPGGAISGGNPGTMDSLSGMADNNLGAGADDVTLNLYYDGMLVGTTTTDSEGNYTINLNSNDLTAGVLVIDATDQGNTYYQSNAPATTITGVNVFANTLSLQGDTASNAALATALGSQTGIGANFSVSGGTLTTHTGIGMDVQSGYTLDGNVTSAGQFVTETGSTLLGGNVSTVTASSVILQGGLNRTGATTFTATAGDIDLESIGGSEQPATAHGLTLTASQNVSIDGCFINLGGGNFSATGSGYTSTTDEDGQPDGLEVLDSQINAQGGNISLTGSGGYAFGNAHQGITAGYGIDLESSTLETTGSANISIAGTFAQNITSLSGIIGLNVYDDVVSAGSGAISLSGSVTAGTAGVNPDVDSEDNTKGNVTGVNLAGGSSIEATATGGSITITGDTSGATSQITGGNFSLSQGVGIDDSTISVASGGSLSIHGTSSNVDTTASTATDGNQPITAGVLVEDGSTLTAGSDSSVTVTGTGGAVQTTGDFTGDSYGVYFSQSNVGVATGGTFTATGHGGAVNAGVGENAGDATSVGTQFDDSAVTVADGSISLTGTGGTLDASQAGTLEGNVGAVSRGILIFDGSQITGTGSTGITFTGTGGNITSGSTLTGGSVGVDFGGNGEEVLTGVTTDSGAVQITGTGGTAPAFGDGVLFSAFNGGETEITSGGALTITGTGGAGYNGDGTIEGNAVPNFGVLVLDNVHLDSAGALKIIGTAGHDSNAVEVEELGEDNVFDESPTLPIVNAGGGLSVTATGGGVDYDGTATSNYTATFTTPGSSSSTIEDAGGPYVLNGGSYTLTGGNISLSTGSAIGALNVTSDNGITLGAVHATSVTLSADTESDITQTGALNTGALTVTSAGDVILSNTGNTISTLEEIASDGDINIYTASGLTLDGHVSGFGDILLQAIGGNLVLGENSEISDFGGEGTLALSAFQPNSVESSRNVTLVTNKSILNNSSLGGNVIQVGPGTNYDLYANSPSGTNLAGIPVDFTLYNTKYPDTDLPAGNGIIYASSENGGGGTGSTTPPGTLAGGGTPIPPAIVPQNDQIAPQEPSNGINLAQTDNSQNPGYSTTDGGIFSQTAASSSDLANFYGGSGQIGANDAAQLNNGELNNVSDPAASSVLDDALSPEVHDALVAALTDVHFVEDTKAGDQPGVQSTAGEQIVGSGDVVEIGAGQVKQIPADQAPQPLKDALGNGVMTGLRPGAGR